VARENLEIAVHSRFGHSLVPRPPRPLAGAGGFEPPVLDPKSSVLPLDDAPPAGAGSPGRRRRAGPPALRSLRVSELVPGARRATRQGLAITRQDLLLDPSPCLAVQRVGDVTEGAVLPLLARHRDEQSARAADDPDVADHEAVVDDDRDERLQLLLIDGEHPDFGDLHPATSPVAAVFTGTFDPADTP